MNFWHTSLGSLCPPAMEVAPAPYCNSNDSSLARVLCILVTSASAMSNSSAARILCRSLPLAASASNCLSCVMNAKYQISSCEKSRETILPCFVKKQKKQYFIYYNIHRSYVLPPRGYNC